MVLYDAPPSLHLSGYIRVFRIIHFQFGNVSHLPFKPYPPRPEHCLCFYPRDPEIVEYTDGRTRITSLRSALVGQHNVVTHRFVGRDFCVIQAVFRPGALYRLTRIPATELLNGHIDAEAVFSTAIKRVNERLQVSGTVPEMLAVIEDFLSRLVSTCRKNYEAIDGVGQGMLGTEDRVSIDRLARAACLSPRQFERKFTERNGVPPRYFSRIVRFAQAYRLKNAIPGLDWLSVAVQSGYYDYQHLVRDYKEFTGQTPARFHLLDQGSPERMFGEADTY